MGVDLVCVLLVMFAQEKKLETLIRKSIEDQDKGVRVSCRQLFLAFANVWPQLAHKIYDTLPKSTQKVINSELKRLME